MIPKGLNTPAAIGIPIKLYILANKKLSLIRRTVLLDKSKQLTTSRRSFCKLLIKLKHTIINKIIYTVINI